MGEGLEGRGRRELVRMGGKQKTAATNTQREVAASQTGRGVSRSEDRLDEWRNVRNDAEMFWLA